MPGKSFVLDKEEKKRYVSAEKMAIEARRLFRNAHDAARMSPADREKTTAMGMKSLAKWCVPFMGNSNKVFSLCELKEEGETTYNISTLLDGVTKRRLEML